MLQVDMSASIRESFGKGAMRRLRVSGNTPAVLYGNDKDVTSLQLETKPFLKTLYQISRKNAVVNLSVDGDTHHVMMREIQTDPVNDSLIHADFFEINLETARTFSVNIELVGKAIGVDRGLVRDSRSCQNRERIGCAGIGQVIPMLRLVRRQPRRIQIRGSDRWSGQIS